MVNAVFNSVLFLFEYSMMDVNILVLAICDGRRLPINILLRQFLISAILTNNIRNMVIIFRGIQKFYKTIYYFARNTFVGTLLRGEGTLEFSGLFIFVWSYIVSADLVIQIQS